MSAEDHNKIRHETSLSSTAEVVRNLLYPDGTNAPPVLDGKSHGLPADTIPVAKEPPRRLVQQKTPKKRYKVHRGTPERRVPKLHPSLLDEEERQRCARNLIAQINSRIYRLSTEFGFEMASVAFDTKNRDDEKKESSTTNADGGKKLVHVKLPVVSVQLSPGLASQRGNFLQALPIFSQVSLALTESQSPKGGRIKSNNVKTMTDKTRGTYAPKSKKGDTSESSSSSSSSTDSSSRAVNTKVHRPPSAALIQALRQTHLYGFTPSKRTEFRFVVSYLLDAIAATSKIPKIKLIHHMIAIPPSNSSESSPSKHSSSDSKSSLSSSAYEANLGKLYLLSKASAEASRESKRNLSINCHQWSKAQLEKGLNRLLQFALSMPLDERRLMTPILLRHSCPKTRLSDSSTMVRSRNLCKWLMIELKIYNYGEDLPEIVPTNDGSSSPSSTSSTSSASSAPKSSSSSSSSASSSTDDDMDTSAAAAANNAAAAAMAAAETMAASYRGSKKDQEEDEDTSSKSSTSKKRKEAPESKESNPKRRK